jgi:hypothetical protein
MKKKKLCWLRVDLQGYSTTLWRHKKESLNVWLSISKTYLYRWLDDNEGFQIKYKNKWYFAYSTDFDFV